MSDATIQSTDRRIWESLPALTPLVLVAAAVVCREAFGSPWQFMWVLAFSIYAFLKWYTWWQCKVESSWPRAVGYLLLWPGMNADKFLSPSPALSSPHYKQGLLACARILAGIALLWWVLPWLTSLPATVVAWIGMIGVALILHFGLFDLLAYAWRSNGVAAERLMYHPMRSTSVASYWGRRWNTAFRDVTNQHLFRPLSRRFSPAVALLIAFFVSGLVHDLVISLPAGGGYGWPTLFFMIQAAALLFERSRFSKRIGLTRGVKGWAFTAAAILLPAPLLFHQPFLTNIVLPMLRDIGALES